MKSTHAVRLTLATLMLSGVAAPAAFADQVEVQVPGIPGESLVDGFRDWIDATAFGQDYNRRSCGGVTISKFLDKASAPLAVAAVNHEALAQATVVVIRSGGKGQQEYLRLLLSDVIVSSIAIQSSDVSLRLTESVRLLPRSVTITYRPQMPDGSLGTAVTTVVTCNRPND